MGDHL